MGQTVNLLVYTFGGSNPSSPTIEAKSNAEVARKKQGTGVRISNHEMKTGVNSEVYFGMNSRRTSDEGRSLLT